MHSGTAWIKTIYGFLIDWLHNCWPLGSVDEPLITAYANTGCWSTTWMLGGVVFGTRTCQGQGLGGFGTVDLGMGRQITSAPQHQASSTLAIHPFQTIFILSTLSDSPFIPRITHIASTDTFGSTRAQKTGYNIQHWETTEPKSRVVSLHRRPTCVHYMYITQQQVDEQSDSDSCSTGLVPIHWLVGVICWYLVQMLSFSQKIFMTSHPPSDAAPGTVQVQWHRSHMTHALSDTLQEHYMADFSLTKDVVATVWAKFSP